MSDQMERTLRIELELLQQVVNLEDRTRARKGPGRSKRDREFYKHFEFVRWCCEMFDEARKQSKDGSSK